MRFTRIEIVGDPSRDDERSRASTHGASGQALAVIAEEGGAMRSQLFAIATVALSGVFTVLMFRSLKLVADAWFIGCVFHADGSKTCRWDVVWLPDPCLPPPPPPPPNTLGGSNGTLMHALFMSLAFGLLTPIGSISFTVRAAACAAAWPRRPPLGTRSPAARPPPPFWPARQRSPLGRQRGGEGGAGREREREGALAAPGCRSKRTMKSAPSTDQARRSGCRPSRPGRRTACS